MTNPETELWFLFDWKLSGWNSWRRKRGETFFVVYIYIYLFIHSVFVLFLFFHFLIALKGCLRDESWHAEKSIEEFDMATGLHSLLGTVAPMGVGKQVPDDTRTGPASQHAIRITTALIHSIPINSFFFFPVKSFNNCNQFDWYCNSWQSSIKLKQSWHQTEPD